MLSLERLQQAAGAIGRRHKLKNAPSRDFYHQGTFRPVIRTLTGDRPPEAK